MPDVILLEDANDIAAFLVYTGRTVSPARWTTEAVDDQNEAFATSAF